MKKRNDRMFICKNQITNFPSATLVFSYSPLLTKQFITRGPRGLYRSPAPHKFIGLYRFFFLFCYFIFSTKYSILNINAFRPVAYEKKILKEFAI